MESVAQKQNIIWQWLFWQFFDVPKAILKAWKNFLFFTLNYFSVPILLKTFFFYWRRYRYSYGRGFDIKRYFDALTFNMLSRSIGAVMRSIFIVIGLCFEIFVFVLGILLFIAWFLLPFLLVGGFWLGIKMIF